MAETGGNSALELLLRVNTDAANRDIDKFFQSATSRLSKLGAAQTTGGGTDILRQRDAQGRFVAKQNNAIVAAYRAADEAERIIAEATTASRSAAAAAALASASARATRLVSGDLTMPAPGSVAETQLRIQGAQSQLQNTVGNPFIILSTISQTITGFARLKKELADSAAALDRLQAELAQVEPGSAAAQRIQGEQAKYQGRADKAIAGMTGPAGMLRAVADFGLNSLITGAFLSVGFQATSAMLEAVMNDLGKNIDYLLNPSKQAAASFANLATALKGVSGSGGLDKLIKLTDAQLQLARATEKTAAAESAITAYIATVRGTAAAARYGMSPQEATLAEQRKLAVSEAKLGLGADTFLGLGVTPEQGREAARALGPEALAAFDAKLKKLTAGLDATTQVILQGSNVGTAFEAAAAAAFDAAVNLDKIASAQAAESFQGAFTNLQNTLFAGGAIGPTGAVQTAQAALSSAQSRLSAEQERVSRANSARQRQLQIEEARRGVGQAGVAGTGDTVFDVAQRIIDAQANLDKAKRSEQIQGNIAKYTKQVADATQTLADEKNLAAFAEATPALVEALKSMTEADRNKEIKRLMSFEFTGNDKTTKALAELLRNLFNAVNGGGKKPDRDYY